VAFAIATNELRSCDDRSFAGMSAIILRGGVEIENPLELPLECLAAYSNYEALRLLKPGVIQRE
jgi:hypothetical protein